MNHFSRRQFLGLGAAASAGVLFSACSNYDPLQASSQRSDDTIVVGSQDYYSNEIIAEVYARALEAMDLKVSRQFRIGQREVYIPEIEAGEIDLFPEYTGPLLRYWQPDASAVTPDDVFTQLQAATPAGLRVLKPAPAQDQDSYAVTKDFAQRFALQRVSDLKHIDIPVTLGGNSEAETRPFGPKVLRTDFGLEVSFQPIEDSGGPLTVKALSNNQVQIAILYSADPAIKANELVVLEDDAGVFLSSNVVPLASKRLSAEAEQRINEINTKLTTAELIAMNLLSTKSQLPAEKIADDWLSANF